MKKNELMKSASRTFNKIGFQIQKKSPELLVAAGIAGIVVSTVMACKATIKACEVAEEAKDTIDEIHEIEEKGVTRAGNTYSTDDAKKDLTTAYLQTGVKYVKLYAPAIVVGAASVSCILVSHKMMKQRMAAVAAALSATDKAFKDYRGRVMERFGEQVEKELRYNIKAKEIEKIITDPETGEEKTVMETVKVIDGDPSKGSPYAVYFDESNPNYCKDPHMLLSFLRAQQTYFNELLQARGHVFLNEVYDALSLPRTTAGAQVGWVYDEANPVGDNYIDFGAYSVNRETQDLLNKVETAILLDFNVDGVILKLIESHQAIM